MNNILFEMLNLANKYKKGFKKLLDEKTDFTLAQWKVLKEIKHNNGKISAVEVARNLEQDKVTIADIVNRLETKGCLIKSKSGNDKRKVHLSLTEKMMNQCLMLKKLEDDYLKSAFNNLSEEEKESLSTLINKLQK